MKFMIVVFLLCVTQYSYAVTDTEVGIYSQQTHEFKTMGGRWPKMVDIYYNPANIQENMFASHPRLVGLSGAERTEMQHIITEDVIVQHIKQLNGIKRSSFYARYRGRKSFDCENDLDSVNGICWNNLLSNTVAGRTFVRHQGLNATPVDAGVLLNAVRLPTLPFNVFSNVVLHELMHVSNFDHEENVIAIMNPKATETLTLYQDDINGFQSLYAFEKSCAPTIYTNRNGVLYFTVRVLFEDSLYRAWLEYRDVGGVGSFQLTQADLLADTDSTICALKLDGDQLHIPYILFQAQRYWLDLRLKSDGMLSIENLGPAS